MFLFLPLLTVYKKINNIFGTFIISLLSIILNVKIKITLKLIRSQKSMHRSW